MARVALELRKVGIGQLPNRGRQRSVGGPKSSATPSVSQVPGFPGPMCRYSFLCQCVELASMRITFDGCVELIGVKRFKPGTKSRKFPRRQLLDGLFNVFGCCHSSNITSRKRREKPCEH